MSIDAGVADVIELRRVVRGPVLAPGDEGYEERRLLPMSNFDDERPAAVVLAQDVDDVVAVVRYAARTGVELAVRSGGHGGAGYATTDGGVVLDLRGLDGLEIDVEGRRATAGAGVTAGRYTREAGAHGLATGFGDTGTVGISGITLGGGVGYLSRLLGLTVDSLLAAEVVTADGVVRHVDAQSEPDLYWALRGGGGNVGVVTSLTLALHEVPSVLGGTLILPATPEVLHGAVEIAAAAPRELGAIVDAMTCPPLPFVPAELHGQPVVMVLLAWAGPVEEGAAVVDRFRALATPLADMVAPIPYHQLFPEAAPPFRPVTMARSGFADAFDLTTAERVLGWLRSSTAPMRVFQVRALGGAIADVPSDATAYAHRDAPLMFFVGTMNGDLAEAEGRRSEVEDVAAAVAAGRTGTYVNFLEREGEAAVHAAYPSATWDRLAAIKREYDPDNLFRRNHNVAPA